MTQLSASQARQDFLQILNRAYAGEEFQITKNSIVMAKIISPTRTKKVVKKRILPGATKLMSHLRGDSVDIVNKWRRREEMRSYGG